MEVVATLRTAVIVLFEIFDLTSVGPWLVCFIQDYAVRAKQANGYQNVMYGLGQWARSSIKLHVVLLPTNLGNLGIFMQPAEEDGADLTQDGA